MTAREQDGGLARGQREQWQDTYRAHPGMYGAMPSAPARHAASVFREAGARNVLELGAGHGRDALYFAREGFTVNAADFSPEGLEQLLAAAREQGTVQTGYHDGPRRTRPAALARRLS